MNDNEFEFPPVFLVVIDNYANVGVCFDVDYPSKIFRAPPLWFLVNSAVNCVVVKHITDWDHVWVQRDVAGGQMADSSFA